jgi:D-aminoacyl-tRNA deacylase
VRALVQRVSEASVAVEGEVVGSIGSGLVVLLGVGRSDGPPQARRLAEKVAALRVFDGEGGRMDRSLLDQSEDAGKGEALCVSQFTLYGDTRRGLRPSFTEAAEPALAEALYEAFCSELSGRGVSVAKGRFRARMSLSLTNEGPVTLLLEV